MDNDRVARLLREVQLSPPLRFIDDVHALKALVADLVLAVGEGEDHGKHPPGVPGTAD